jgi:hypothetical protein
MLLEAGADPNDSQALYNRQFEPDDGHLRLLIEFGLGTDRGGPWHRCCTATTARRPTAGRPTVGAAQFDRPAGRGWRWPRAPTPTVRHRAPRAARPYALRDRRPPRELEVAELLRAAGAAAPAVADVDAFLIRAWRRPSGGGEVARGAIRASSTGPGRAGPMLC